MGLDLNKVRSTLENINRSGNFGSKAFWKPKIGSYTIRIVPYAHDKSWPFIEGYFYYPPFAKFTVNSPIILGQPDPVVELAEQLKSSGDKADWKMGMNLMPKTRTFVPVLVRGEEEKGVQFWGISKTVNEQLLKFMDDPEYGDLTSLNDGTDLVVEIEKPSDGTLYNKTSVRPKRSTSKVTTDKAVLASLDDQPTIEELWTVPTYDEMKKYLENYLNNVESEIEPEEEVVDPAINDLPDDFDLPNPTTKQVEKLTGKKSAKVETPKSTSLDDIDSTFDDIFN